MVSPQIQAKDAAGKAAAELIKNGMRVGLGTGSTAAKFIEHLALLCQRGLEITVAASSKESESYAASKGIMTVDFDDLERIDITVDGADEIDPNKQMIKGGGGALLREKILASSSKEMIVIVDSTKLVENLGSQPVPVEIIPFGSHFTIRKIEQAGYKGSLRAKEGSFFITDNGNYIYDIRFQGPIDEPSVHQQALKAIPGVVETGLFIGIAGRVVVGYPNGSVEIHQ